MLVVDDDVAGRMMLALSLRQAGFKVRTAGCGEEALKCLQAQRHDWLLTDGRMEPMDGFELSVRAKRLQPDLKIAMISAMYSARDGRGFPIDRFLAKPLQLESLMACLGDK